MRLHLAICPVCSQARDELVELAEAGEGRPGLTPSFTPRPRLSFLSPRPESQAQARTRPGIVGEISRVVIRFSHEIRRSLQPAMPAPPVAAGLRSSVGQVVVKDAIDDLKVVVEIQQDLDSPERCTIFVEAQIPSRDWPHLDGTAVTLRQDDRDLDTQLTDSYGRVVFDDVLIDDLPSLAIVVQPSA